jgi:hypothetical protein
MRVNVCPVFGSVSFINGLKVNTVFIWVDPVSFTATGATLINVDQVHAVSHTQITGAISMAHTAPDSKVQVALHPSPVRRLLSSQFSPVLIMPFPQVFVTGGVYRTVVLFPVPFGPTTVSVLEPLDNGTEIV